MYDEVHYNLITFRNTRIFPTALSGNGSCSGRRLDRIVHLNTIRRCVLGPNAIGVTSLCNGLRVNISGGSICSHSERGT